jgi:hypothetical protein
MRVAIKSLLKDLLGYNEINQMMEAADRRQIKEQERIAMIEQRLVENTRALATLALVQANLVKELDSILNSLSGSSKTKTFNRKIDPDFTN